MKSRLLHILFLLLLLAACGGADEPAPPLPEPDEPQQPAVKPVMLWVDASANFSRFVSRQAVGDYLAKAKEAGFNTIILDVRPTSGEVMYPGSAYADEIVTWKGVTRDTSWDYLGYFIQECHRMGLRIYAAMNTFTAGQNIMRRGTAYTRPEVAAMTTRLYTSQGLVDGLDDTRGAVFINPALPEAQQYVLNIACEIVRRYEIDGLVLDRCRYDNETADFSDASRDAFARYVKEKYGREGIKFPSDIFSYDKNGNRVYGVYRQIWYEWRASVIHDFFFKMRQAVKAIKPNLVFATYTGGWYSTYYQEGSNWASSGYDPSTEFPVWADSRYKETGFAEALDYHLAGFYYSELSGSGWWTIAGGISNVKRVNMGACPVVASLTPEKFPAEKDRSTFQAAVKLCMDQADGLMVFDLYHVEQYDYWSIIKAGTTNH